MRKTAKIIVEAKVYNNPIDLGVDNHDINKIFNQAAKKVWEDVATPNFETVDEARTWATANVVGEYRVKKIYAHGRTTLEQKEVRVHEVLD